jgi:predicted ester cyclase
VSSEEEKNKALARRFMEARAKVDLNAIELMMATDLISHGILPGQLPGREGLKRWIAEIAATFSNRRRFIEDQIAEADKVVTRYTLGATHDRKEIMGAAPTGREVTYKAIVTHRISGVRSPRSGVWELLTNLGRSLLWEMPRKCKFSPYRLQKQLDRCIRDQGG